MIIRRTRKRKRWSVRIGKVLEEFMTVHIQYTAPYAHSGIRQEIVKGAYIYMYNDISAAACPATDKQPEGRRGRREREDGERDGEDGEDGERMEREEGEEGEDGGMEGCLAVVAERYKSPRPPPSHRPNPRLLS